MILGPGSLDQPHRTDEHVEIPRLWQAVEIYAALLSDAERPVFVDQGAEHRGAVTPIKGPAGRQSQRHAQAVPPESITVGALWTTHQRQPGRGSRDGCLPGWIDVVEGIHPAAGELNVLALSVPTQLAEPVLEGIRDLGRPEGGDSYRPQRVAHCGQAIALIKPLVVTAHREVRPVVGIHQDDVEPGFAVVQKVHDIHDPQVDVWIAQRMIGQRRQNAAVPVGDGRDQLADSGLRTGSREVERGPQGEPHAEPADQHAEPIGAVETS